MTVLSLDVSAASTGWSLMTEDTVYYGLIKTSPNDTRANRLMTYNIFLRTLLLKYKPEYVVIEDVFVGLNAKTIKVLAEFAGVTKLACAEVLAVEPYVISTNTVKAYYKQKKKTGVFTFLSEEVLEKSWSFKKYNDIIDSIAQLLCYCDSILGLEVFRYSKEYGYLYIVDKELSDYE